jgi:flagellar biosynthesis protein FlhA
VSARFTLDAMPGKQMGIDADLNSGLINEQQARQRRDEIEKEADFYGAMDGAAKFVRGDAIASVIITLINVLGGFVIGVVQNSLSVSEAASRYTLLTIGDGLVSQIPALIISTSAGIIVTRAAGLTNLSEMMTRQLLFSPRALGVASVILFFFAVLPGLPFLPFGTMGLMLGATAYFTARFQQQSAEFDARQIELDKPPPEPERVESLLPLDLISLEVGYNLIPLVDSDQNGGLLERIKSIRRQFALDMGFVVPPLHIRDNLELKPGGYSLLVKGCEVAGGELMTGHLLAMSPGGAEDKSLQGIPTTEPAFGLPAIWIPEREREKAQSKGYTVVDLATVVATHLTEVLRRHSHELLTRQDTQGLLDQLGKRNAKAVEGVASDVISLPTMQKILQNLLKEQVSIRDLLTIVETVGEVASKVQNPDQITELVRQALSRNITKQYVAQDGKLYLMVLDQEIEDAVVKSTKVSEAGSFLAMEPSLAQRILSSIRDGSDKFGVMNLHPVLACIPQVRQQLVTLTEKFIPGLVVLSHAEISPSTDIESLGVVRLSNAN